MPQATEARGLNEDEQSCKVFVQKFYDWYWNRTVERMSDPSVKGSDMPSMEEILRHRPQFLSAKLQSLLREDAELKRNADGIVGSEFDPFLNDGNGGMNTTRFQIQNCSC